MTSRRRRWARADPVGFIRNLPPKRIALDEVQRVPETLLAIKQAVDENRTPGRFLLTGSANALLRPRSPMRWSEGWRPCGSRRCRNARLPGREPTFLGALLRGEAPWPGTCGQGSSGAADCDGLLSGTAVARERTTGGGLVSAVCEHTHSAGM